MPALAVVVKFDYYVLHNGISRGKNENVFMSNNGQIIQLLCKTFSDSSQFIEDYFPSSTSDALVGFACGSIYWFTKIFYRHIMNYCLEYYFRKTLAILFTIASLINFNAARAIIDGKLDTANTVSQTARLLTRDAFFYPLDE